MGTALVKYAVYIFLLLGYCISIIKVPYFFTWENQLDIIMSSMSMLIACSGLIFVVMCGFLDVSLGSIAFVSAATVATLLKNHSLYFAILCGLSVALVIGAINGILIAWFYLNPLLITLGILLAMRGLGLQITKGSQIEIPQSIRVFYIEKSLGLPNILWIVFFLLIFLHMLLKYSVLGRYIVAVGCDKEQANAIGLPVNYIVFIVFCISAVMAGISGCISMFYIGSFQPYLGKGLEFNAINAILLGGTALSGGFGSIFPRTIIGVFFISITENILNLLGVSPFLYPLFTGLNIFLKNFLDSFKKIN